MLEMVEFMNLAILTYLRGGKTLPDLEAEYAITPRRHKTFANLVLLKYSQIASPMNERIVQECRGIILDEADSWKPVCVPYFKFFNYGEVNAATIDWAQARVYEKLDGSLMSLYWYGGDWQVASSGLPDASGPTGAGMTFAELFWKTWNAMGYALPLREKSRPEICYMFEMMTPLTRIVVPHTESTLVLHGVRELDGFTESAPEFHADRNGWRCVRTFPLNTLENVLASCAEIDPLACEGYVVCDAAYNRIKVKSPQYVALAHLKDSMSPRRMLEVIRSNESSEFLNYFPELRSLYDQVEARFLAAAKAIDAEYPPIQHIASQKDFAFEALKTACPAAMFAIRSGKFKNAKEFLASCTRQVIERLVSVEDLMPVVAEDGQ